MTVEQQHELLPRGADNGRFIVACSCGWESEPIHPINVDVVGTKHLRDVGALPAHEHTREESGRRYIRVACTCGWRGPWRDRTAHLLDKQLHSDDGQHLYAVRRGEA